MYELLYTKLNCRSLFKGNKKKIMKQLHDIKPERWAVYSVFVKGNRFHNASDVDFLVDHNDDFWYNKKVVPSGLFSV